MKSLSNADGLKKEDKEPLRMILRINDMVEKFEKEALSDCHSKGLKGNIGAEALWPLQIKAARQHFGLDLINFFDSKIQEEINKVFNFFDDEYFGKIGGNTCNFFLFIKANQNYYKFQQAMISDDIVLSDEQKIDLIRSFSSDITEEINKGLTLKEHLLSIFNKDKIENFDLSLIDNLKIEGEGSMENKKYVEAFKSAVVEIQAHICNHSF